MDWQDSNPGILQGSALTTHLTPNLSLQYHYEYQSILTMNGLLTFTRRYTSHT